MQALSSPCQTHSGLRFSWCTQVWQSCVLFPCCGLLHGIFAVSVKVERLVAFAAMSSVFNDDVYKIPTVVHSCAQESYITWLINIRNTAEY